MQNPRECALDVLIKVDKKEELSHIAISNVLEKYQFSEKRDRAFFTRLVEGTLERQITIDYVADQFSKTKIRKCKPLIRALLRMGIYQILYMDQVPDSAACNEAVKLAKKRGFSRLSGFVNGVLRNTENSAINIGICINKGKHPANGLILASVYIFIISCCCFSGLSLYLVCISSILGCISCIAFVDFVCLIVSGSNNTFTTIVNNIIESP